MKHMIRTFYPILNRIASKTLKVALAAAYLTAGTWAFQYTVHAEGVTDTVIQGMRDDTGGDPNTGEIPIEIEVEKPAAATISEDGTTVTFVNTTVGGLAENYVENYYTGKKGANSGKWTRESLSLVDRIDMDSINNASSSILAEKGSVKAVYGQSGELLPRIWKYCEDGERILINPWDVNWETSDDGVVSIIDGVPVIAGTGDAVLIGRAEDSIFTVNVSITDADEVSDFVTDADQLYTLGFDEDGLTYTAVNTRMWPTALPDSDEDGEEETLKIKGKRIYQCGSQYYYLKKDAEAEWSNELLFNPAYFGDDVICLSQGLILMEGDNLNGIVPGVVFRHHDQFWVFEGSEQIGYPYNGAPGWIEISELFEESHDDYVPGADTGPESDALFYYESQFNPYPGTISSNCTFAVWALANQAVGARLPNWGDAGNWFRRAGISGYKTGDKPAANSIIVWDHHVGYVTEVSEDGTMIYIKEGNFGGRYHEGWWPVSSSRHGMAVYGYIYLTEDTGEQNGLVVLPEGLHCSEEEFLATLEELGLNAGEKSEEYSDKYEAGTIIRYTSGEMIFGSFVDYTVSLGAEEAEEELIIIDSESVNEVIGMTRGELQQWLHKRGLNLGNETVEDGGESDENSTVIAIQTGPYKKEATVNYTVSRKPTEETSGQTGDTKDGQTENPEEGSTGDTTVEQNPETTGGTPEETGTDESSAEGTSPESTQTETPAAETESQTPAAEQSAESALTETPAA